MRTRDLTVVLDAYRGSELEKAIIVLIALLWTRPHKWLAISEVTFRTHLPNLLSLLTTIGTFLSVIVLEDLKSSVGLVPADPRKGQLRSAFRCSPHRQCRLYSNGWHLIRMQRFLELVAGISKRDRDKDHWNMSINRHW
jgi:hypothetical protein